MDAVSFPLGPEAISQYRQALFNLPKSNSDERRQANRAIQRGRSLAAKAYSDQFLQRSLQPGTAADESLVWFWFNHFNVYWGKDLVGVALSDYVDNVIRPHVRGRFRDLLLSIMTHPAMLVYLDNARNVAGKINENYARELLELHTLGVDGGYGQADVQEVARLLTGFGLRPSRPVRWSPKFVPMVRGQGEFLFDPRRHDFADKQVLGRRIAGEGYAELEALADLLVRHPATARHLAGKLCLFLVGEDVPRTLVDQAAAVFAESGGDLGQVVTRIRQGAAALAKDRPRTFKDPFRWLTSSVTVLAGGRPVGDVQLLARWLTALGQPLFGCRTPDGYSLRGSDWVSAGQLTQRFELARDMVRALPRLLDGALPVGQILASAPVRALEASLGAQSQAALARADKDAGERLALLISSPEFMYW